MATILIGTSISMSKTQPLGEGWLDGECYIVNNGVYIISAILVFITLSTTLGPLIFKIRKKDQAQTSWIDKRKNIYTQIDEKLKCI